MILRVSVSVLMVLACFQARADTTEGLAWLNRVVQAAQRLNYVGTFEYRSGAHTETSRIAHVVLDGVSSERLEVLDGSPREVVRINDDVMCYLPRDKIVIQEKRGTRRSFPALLPDSLASVVDHYGIRKGEHVQVAGLDSQLVHLEPKDGWRFGHLLWIDTHSGLLLKARMVDEHGEVVEQFAFSQIHIGASVDREAVKSRFAALASGWKLQNMQATEIAEADLGWEFRNPLPGFRQLAGMRRSLGSGKPEMLHVVFSDGLAAVSVFIEPLRRAEPVVLGSAKHGAVNVFKRRVGDMLITALGEVPSHSLERIAEGVVERKGKS